MYELPQQWVKGIPPYPIIQGREILPRVPLHSRYTQTCGIICYTMLSREYVVLWVRFMLDKWPGGRAMDVADFP